MAQKLDLDKLTKNDLASIKEYAHGYFLDHAQCKEDYLVVKAYAYAINMFLNKKEREENEKDSID